MSTKRIELAVSVAFFLCASCCWAGQRQKVMIVSSVDGTAQPSYVMVPAGWTGQGEPRPLLVSLHSWSGDCEQRNEPLEKLADERGWVCLFPNFRGRNDNPSACGSAIAQQDILDAVTWTQKNYSIDRRRIYLTGASGGGHMTMLMVGAHPDIWAAASAWVGISDLAAWHRTHAGKQYGNMLEECCGGAPGSSDQVDEQYRQRSPLTHLARAVHVPLDIAAGIHDGHSGSVPIEHSLRAFNVLARAAGKTEISAAEIAQLSGLNGRLEKPLASDQVVDASFGRQIHLRRQAGPARVTIFEGGHEGIAAAAIAWLEQHAKH